MMTMRNTGTRFCCSLVGVGRNLCFEEKCIGNWGGLQMKRHATACQNNALFPKFLKLSTSGVFTHAQKWFFNLAGAAKDRDNGICWKCRKSLTATSKFLCEHCCVILPLPQLTYFEILDMKESFNVLQDKLQKKFKDSQKLFHPDKYTLKSDEEKLISERVSSLLNAAYFTLSSPLQRGIYLLKLKAITISEDTQLSDPEFLMEVMDLNEEIAECGNNESLEKIQRQVKDESSKLVEIISQSFADEQLEKAKNSLVKLRYYSNMAEKLKHLIPPS